MVPLAALTVGLLIGGLTFALVSEDPVVASAGDRTPAADPERAGEPVADVAAKLSPSVVLVETNGGTGSGLIVTADGLILTANHVVEHVEFPRVTLSDGREFQGKVVGRSPANDIAVISIDASGLNPANISADDVRVGQLAIAVGSPFGFDQTVTSGVVSGLNRTLDLGSTRLEGLIQTDAPINPGSSGGPLADRDGDVIGINVAIASRSGGNDGVGFAVPIAEAMSALDQISSDRSPVPSEPAPRSAPFGDLGERFGGLRPVEIPVRFGHLPDGWSLTSTSWSMSGAVERSEVTLVASDGFDEITLVAAGSDAGDALVGQHLDRSGAVPIDVDGSARAIWYSDGDSTVIAWLEEGGAGYVLTGPTSLGLDELASVANDLESEL